MTDSTTPNSAPATRFPHWTQLVEHERVPRFVELGWEPSTALLDTHHGERATLMVWPHETEPPNER